MGRYTCCRVGEQSRGSSVDIVREGEFDSSIEALQCIDAKLGVSTAECDRLFDRLTEAYGVLAPPLAPLSGFPACN